MPKMNFGQLTPTVPASVWIAPDGWVIGDVQIGEESSVFFGAVARGDILPIRIGTRTNLQDGCMLHTSTGLTPCIVGDDVTIGHHAIIHGSTVGNRCIVGMGATILDGAEIGDDCIIGANSLVTMNTKIPAGSMVFGSPAKMVRKLKPEELKSIVENAMHYCKTASAYKKSS